MNWFRKVKVIRIEILPSAPVIDCSKYGFHVVRFSLLNGYLINGNDLALDIAVDQSHL